MKQLLYLSLFLICTTGIVSSCGDENEDMAPRKTTTADSTNVQQQTPTDSTTAPTEGGPVVTPADSATAVAGTTPAVTPADSATAVAGTTPAVTPSDSIGVQPVDSVQTDPAMETTTLTTLFVSGWTQGSNAYASYIPSEGDALTVTFVSNEPTCTLYFQSPTWGTATLRGVAITKTATGYEFSKPVTATLRDDRSAWDFSSDVDSIAMPNRNPQAGAATVKNYPIVLTAGRMSLDGKDVEVTFEAYLVPQSAHVQTMCFRDGKIGDM